jgi:Lactoylglutathione lyase and related lyases
MARSRRFYTEVLGQTMIADFGGHITFSGDFALQTGASWLKSTGREEVAVLHHHHSGELYFEEESFDLFVARLKARDDIEYLHDVFTESTGQRVIRFYDPDGHLLEVGECMTLVIKRLIDSGLTIGQTMERTGYPEEFILAKLRKLS